MCYLNLFNSINNLTLLQLNLLIKHIETSFNLIDFNVSKNTVEKNINNNLDSITNDKEIEITIESVLPDKKITLLKFIKNNFNLSLKESKDIIDNLPKIIKKCSKKEEADNFKKQLEESGAKVVLK